MTLLPDRAPVLGALWALFAAVGFSVVDLIVKFLSEDYPHYELTFFRTVVAFIVIAAFILPFSGGYKTLKTKRPWLHLLRGLCVVLANLAFFLALAAMPLAEAVAIFFVSPFLVAIFSVIFLGETVGPRRWGAIAFGMWLTARRHHGLSGCSSCGYPRVGWKGKRCPECGANEG